MYSKEQASAIRQTFWKTFGQYIAMQPSADGMRINWVNYKTGIKNLYFKMTAENKTACIMIEMSDPNMRELMYEQFEELKSVLHATLDEEWEWEPDARDEQNRTVSRISTCIEGVSVFRQEDWPELISFFKPRIIALDEFWSNARYSFELFK
ncbi:DUF4268 domain-containing protein [Taibaiella soli]|uniref:DUF4268 domain-containing protein n=1 Tax=Taibaiella soli TaxID=1649169 RepID=A0A2W2ASC1_9BACT|nr:DUF4268 domain-containing protein [Taibaiella soli]PZF70884.1 DUF4268 domain-containing protein [Taibaiella soli]